MAELSQEERRKAEEADFHDRRERDRQNMSEEEFLEHYPNKRFYLNATPHLDYLDSFIAAQAPGAKALDYCCGLGGTSLRLLEAGAHVTGIDISEASVDTARSRAEAAGHADSSDFRVMDAESLTFEDDSFDLIICAGVLHHLDVARAYPELARVLRPGGKILCGEALGYNPFIQAYRKLTPKLRTEWEADHILTNRELRLAEKYFKSVSVEYFYLASIPALMLPSNRVGDAARKALFALDRLLLKVPFVQLLAWQMIFTLQEPLPSER